MSDIKKGALVYYKSKAAYVEEVSDKISISFFNTTKRVRDKDILFLHSGPISDVSTLDLERPRSIENLDETLELLEGETFSLAELAELLYGEFTPQSAWSSWMLVVDNLYFEGQGSTEFISVRPLDDIKADQQKREEKIQQKQAWDSLIARIKSNQIEAEDYSHLSEVEQVATAEREQSRILKAVGVSENKESAHALLIRLGYWKEDYNPWPRRMGVNMENPELSVPQAVSSERKDLRHLKAWAIDDVGNKDPDDAISFDGERLWVHIADVSSLVEADSELDIEARSRGTNVYLPDQVIHMLPEAITEQLGLGLHEESPALSISFKVADSGELEDIQICFSTLNVTRTTYDDVDKELEQDDNPFVDLKAVTERYHQRRLSNDAAMLDFPEVSIKVRDGTISIHPFGRSESRQLVTEAMLAAGEAIAHFATENNIPIPYAYQVEPEEIQYPEKLSEHYAYRRCFKASKHSTVPASHFGLGLPCYTRVTSPMRRYLDLIVHQQLRAFLTDQPLLEADSLVERIGLADEGSFAARKTERFSRQHWTLLYLKQESETKKWQGEATVVYQDERKITVILPDVALEPKLRRNGDFELDSSITVQLSSINIADLQANFRII